MILFFIINIIFKFCINTIFFPSGLKTLAQTWFFWCFAQVVLIYNKSKLAKQEVTQIGLNC